jgi:alginate O-acetyltransferase complex protein AlgI
MLFNSLDFVFFFPVVTLLYFLLPHKWRWVHLLVASCIFYMYFIPVYILILFFTIIIDYIAGILIEGAGSKGARKAWLIVSIAANVGVLSVFKYYNFFIGNINELLHISGSSGSIPLLNIILPVGLSFHTFQAMSYTIEVYKGDQPAERHLGIYALYVMFYPQLVAGPIERPQNLLPQFREKHNPDYNNIVTGLRLMLWGMVKKVVIADRIGLITDPIFNHPHDFNSVVLYMGVALFHIQVFCDFSAYSDIAIGAARVMGFKLMTNFNMPFHARTVSEFWRRWHISLSTWFRDYVYVPLGGNKDGRFKIYRNLFIVCFLSGLWHGASWLFVIWGLLQGAYMIIGHMTKKWRKKLNETVGTSKVKWLDHALDIIITFSLTAFARVFFRGNSLDDARYFVWKLKDLPADLLKILRTHHIGLSGVHPHPEVLPAVVVMVIGLEVAHLLKLRYDLEHTFSSRPALMRWGLYFSGLILLLFFGVYNSQRFIYFQF